MTFVISKTTQRGTFYTAFTKTGWTKFLADAVFYDTVENARYARGNMRSGKIFSVIRGSEVTDEE